MSADAKQDSGGATLYAEVAVNLPVAMAYTYRVAKALVDVVRVGSMVRVPMRGGKTEGVVIALTETPPKGVPKKRIKNIERVLTPEYAIDAGLLALGRWMSDYYVSPPGETLGAISFFGLADMQPRTERLVRLSNMALWQETDEDNQPPVTERQREVVWEFLEDLNEPLTRAETMRRVGCSASVIDALLKKGVLDEIEATVERDDGYGAAAAPESPHDFTDEQRAAFDAIAGHVESEEYGAFLLRGITGSGKTEIYLQAIARVLEAGREAIVLVPEISLTPQAVDRFRKRFGGAVGVYHSHLNRGQKYDLWRRIASGAVRVLIGARSAVFAPFANLGLIVVDEEHEHSYKQGDPAPRYHARDVAVWRAHRTGIPVVLGSATPSLESVWNTRPGPKGEEPKYTRLELTKRVADAQLPDIRLVDMGRQVREEGETEQISRPLAEAIEKRLERGEQSILFLNRRGFSNFLICMACKQVVRCPHCDVVMTWHKSINRLMCHFCGETALKPDACPECGAENPAPIGAGTQRIEEEVSERWPDARLLRIDLDTTRGKHGFLRLWEQIERGEADILLGTQMIAKGLHLEKVTLVGVISADHALFLPDFRAAERAFAQLTQVAGRAGRMQQQGEVFLQTYVPNSYAIQRAIHHDVEGFWEQEMHMREVLRFPPQWKLLLVRVTGDDQKQVITRAKRLGGLLRDRLARNQDYRKLSVLGPTPCPIARLQDRHRWQLTMRGQSPALMRRALREALAVFEKDKGRSGVHLTFDMDPMDLL